MSIFTRHDAFDLHDEIAALRNEVAELGSALSKRGGRSARRAHDGASELYHEIVEAIATALPAVRAPARKVGRAMRENPDRAIAIAGLAALTIAAAAIWGGRR